MKKMAEQLKASEAWKERAQVSNSESLKRWTRWVVGGIQRTSKEEHLAQGDAGREKEEGKILARWGMAPS